MMALHRSPSIIEEPTPLVDHIHDHIERFVTGLKRGKLGQRDGTSLSTTAACETVSLMLTVVKLFAHYEILPGSQSVQDLRAQYPAVHVATKAVQYLLRLIKMAGDAVLRSQFSSLLLINVTRRVLSIIREAAAQNSASEGELEREAAALLCALDEEPFGDDRKIGGPESSGDLGSGMMSDRTPVERDEDTDDGTELSSGGESANARGVKRGFQFPRDFANTPPRSSLSTRGKDGSHSEQASPTADEPEKREESPGDTDGNKRKITVRFAMEEGAMSSNTQSGEQQQGNLDDHILTSPNTNKRGGLRRASGNTHDLMQAPDITSDSSVASPENVLLAGAMPGHNVLKRAPSRLDVADEKRVEQFPVRMAPFLESAIDRLTALTVEIESMCEELCKRASKQLHASDTVISIGSSHTTSQYLLQAAEDLRKRGNTFKVIIVEGAPFPVSATLKLADQLRARDVPVQVLPDSSIFAVMGTCTKVIVGVESVLANGGVLAPTGTHPLCIAAQHFAVPVLVVTTTLKMSPYYPSDALCTRLVRISRSSAQEIPWSIYGSPNNALSQPYGEQMNRVGMFTVHSPVVEYVPPALITLYATNESEFTPSQIHRVVRENYNPED